MELPQIRIKYIILNKDGTKHREGTYNFMDPAERKSHSARFNDCLLDGYTVTTRRIK